jgi:hypothetical protein
MSVKIVFACDESGAKGYADRTESYPGEVGVFAGVLVPDQQLPAIKARFDSIAARYKPLDEKLHITDLRDTAKEELREEIYTAIRECGLTCFWYALHVAGLHADHVRQEQIAADLQKAYEERRGGAEPRVKTGSPRSEPSSMHVTLFAGLYGHLVAFLLERRQIDVDVEIRTDQVDSPVMKEFSSVAARLLSDDPNVHRKTGFDTVTKRVVEGSITIEAVWPPELQLPPVVRSLTIAPVADDDGLVLAADVLSNSLNYLFKNRSDAERYGPLNTPEAVARHPLAKHLDAFNEWGADLVGDAYYRHPNASQ